MSRYVITISTDAYKPLKASEKNWERGTVNDFMEALNDYRVTERSLKAVRRRIRLFRGCDYPEEGENIEAYYNWRDDSKAKTRITFFDKLCGFERTEFVSPYGIKQGDINLEKTLNTLKTCGIVKIPFEAVYDTRQASSRLFKGCYMKIVKK